MKARQPWYRLDNNEFSHFSYWGRMSNDVFAGPAQNNFAEPTEDEPFTEVCDRDGVELYDGDIVLFLRSLGYQSNKGDIGVICKDTSELGFLILNEIDGYPISKLTTTRAKSIKKIGTKHENPELLQK